MNIVIKNNNQKIIVGHKGGAREHYPNKKEAQEKENTIDAFEKGFKSGADLIECDLNITKDGVICIYHNPYIIEKGAKKYLKDFIYTELQSRKLDICSLDELLETFKDNDFVFELKDDNNWEKIIDIFYSKYPERFEKNRFISFSLRALLFVKEKSEQTYCIYIGSSYGDAGRKEIFIKQKHIDICEKHKLQEIAGHWATFSPDMIKEAHEKGLNVGLGPINHSLARNKAKQADIIYTDKVVKITEHFKLK
jgi:glycerophosphoryl diester phosphodiesterase